ncbi:hypothetical protein BJV74DRAFT_883173 [Russula compacta]|nr:hypothetical protein BJV74DRAFT_883173 [Russula compacta]
MLAAISPPAHNISQPLPYSHSPTTTASTLLDPVSPAENKVCPGCQLTVMDENGGVVIAFGVCHQPILDEAIMTGDDSYHAHCFKCRSCHNRIEELMFAKTSHGIYCMKCHHQRVVRSRRHAQKHKERDSTPVVGSSSKSQSAPHANAPAGLSTTDSAANSLAVSTTSTAQTSSDWPRPVTSLHRSSSRSQPQTSQSARQSTQLDDHLSNCNTFAHVTVCRIPQADSSSPQRLSSGPSSPVIIMSPDVPEAGPQVTLSYLQHEASNDSGNATPLLTPDALTSVERRKSYDDGTRPLNVLYKNGAPPPGSSLSARLYTSRPGKRNSINPGLSFNYETLATEFNTKSSSAPQSPSSSPLPTPDVGQTPGHTDTQRLPVREQASEGLSRRPSRKAPPETPTSAPAVSGSHLSRSRSRTESSPKAHIGIDPIVPPPRQNTVLERLPPRTHSLKASSLDPDVMIQRPPPMTSVKSNAPRRTSSDEKDKPKPAFSLSIDVERSQAGHGLGKRPMSPAYKAASPAHKVDVPHGIESGTDTSDGEREPSTNELTRTPSLPSSEKEAKSPRRPAHLELNTKQSASQEEPGEVSFLNSAGDADSEDESSPVERVSRSTFIAPAHPPIRFSVTANGFQELLSQINPRKRSSFRSIEELVKLNQDAEAHLDAGLSASSLSPDSGATQNEGGRSSTPSSAAAPTTTIVYSSTANNSSVTTISAPSSQGHSDSFIILDQPETTNSVESDFVPQQRGLRNPWSTPRRGLDPKASAHHTDASLSELGSHFTVTAPDSSVAPPANLDSSYSVTKRLQDALQDAARRGTPQITFDQEFVQDVVMIVEQRRDENAKMKRRLDQIKRASQQAMDGLTVAHSEYEGELKARREAESEVSRLRVLLSGQAARITALSSQGRRDELHKQLTHDLRNSLNVLEQDVAKLKAERDVALVEMEELTTSRSMGSSGPVTDRDRASLGRSLSTRLDSLKVQYESELASLTDERESLLREIAELQSARASFLKRQRCLMRATKNLPSLMLIICVASKQHRAKPQQLRAKNSRSSVSISSWLSNHPTHSTKIHDKRCAFACVQVAGNNKEATAVPSTAQDGPNEKAWPSTCSTRSAYYVCQSAITAARSFGARRPAAKPAIYRYIPAANKTFTSSVHHRILAGTTEPQRVLYPAMFGHELTEQVRADSRLSDRMVPIIVEKCIAAVEASALDHEGIYRKNGGAGQSKTITQLFERGDYAAFDLFDTERFNDICSVTSVLKSYFRSLPNPLLTFALHDEFITASSIQDPIHKSTKYADLVKQLPTEHYYTLRILMLHLYQIQEHRKENLMTARNLGVVFGPTLMRSRNPGTEFSDMAGKALTIEWLVENAPTIFPPLPTSH